MNIRWMMLGAGVVCTCALMAAEQPADSNAVSETEWGDISSIEVQGVTLGMTRQDVVRKWGDVKASAYATGVPYVFKELSDPTGVHYKVTVYFGVAGTCSNRAVAIENTLFGASMADRNTVVETLQEKFGFEDDYLEHRPKGSTTQLRDDYQNLPQYEQALNDRVSLLFRVDWDSKKQRTYLITVMYRHAFYNVTAEILRMARPDDGQERRREQIKQIF